MKSASTLKRLVACLLVAGISLFCLSCESTVVLTGSAMEPTISDGEEVPISTDAYRASEPQRGDIVLIKLEGGGFFVARVIGLPGETVTIEDGSVYIDGALLNEDYLAPGTRTESETTEFLAPDRSYFVMGDNRATSTDSRHAGFILRDWITAKVLL